MAVAGVFTSDSGIQGERTGDFASSILRHQPNGSAKLLALTSGMKSRDTMDVMIHWFEQARLTGRTTITNNAGTGGTLVITDGSEFVAGAVMMIETTGEYVFVTNVVTNTLTVERGFAGTTIAAVDGSVTPVGIQRVGNAHEEASARPTAVRNLGYPVFNYCQIFRDSWEISGTADAVDYRTGKQKPTNKRDCSILHSENLERSLIFGRKSVGVKNNRPFRTMDGVHTMIATNTEVQGANITRTELNDFLEAIYTYNIVGQPNERIAFCGNAVVRIVNELVFDNSQYNISAGETKFGMKVIKWMTPFGDITLMTHPLFVENPVWNELLLVLHPGAITTRYLRRTAWDNHEREGTKLGTDADFGVVTTEMSVEMGAEKTAGWFSGINTAA